MDTNGTRSGPGTVGTTREYRHTRHARARAAFIAACCGLLALYFSGILLALLDRDLGYMRLWPWWFQALFWITLVGFVGFTSCAWAYVGVRQLVLTRRHYGDVAIVDDEGLTLVQGRVPVHFPWEHTRIDRPAFFLTRLHTGGQDRFVMAGMREAATGQMLAEELRAHQPDRLERQRLLHEGERIPVVVMRSRRPLFFLFGTCGALIAAAPLLWLLLDALETSVTHEPPSIPRLPGGTLGGGLVSLAGIAFALVSWGLLSLSPRLSGLQFTAEEWRYWNWRGWLLVVPYASILSVQWRARPKRGGRGNLRISYADQRARRGQRRLSFSTDTFWSTDTLTMLRDELLSRAGLVPSPEDAQAWVRPGTEG